MTTIRLIALQTVALLAFLGYQCLAPLGRGLESETAAESEPAAPYRSGLPLGSGEASRTELAARAGEQARWKAALPDGEREGRYLYALAVALGVIPDTATDSRAVLQRLADAGMVEAQFTLARAFYEGVAGPNDPAGAAVYMRAAAAAKLPEAMVDLAFLLSRGAGLEADPQQALTLVTDAASMGYEPARPALMQLLVESGFDPGEFEGSEPLLVWISESAGRGDRNARYLLARRLIALAEGPAWPAEAGRLMRESARQGCDQACAELGLTILNNEVDGQADEAIRLLEKAGNEGEPTAVMALIALYGEGREDLRIKPDPDRARSWQERGLEVARAEMGRTPHDVEVLLDLVRLIGDPGDDATRAEVASALTFAALRGDARAQYGLGRLFVDGSGAASNPVLGTYLLRLAAEQDHPEAAFELAGMLREADRPADAVRWLTAATAAGHDEATTQLAACYREGTGVVPDPELAAELERLAGEREEP